MGRRELLNVLLTLMLLLSMVFHRGAAMIRRIGKYQHPGSTSLKASRKDLDVKDEYTREAGDNNGSGDYDFYGGYGDVPSPGVGH
ncbi:hypothetical protein Pyn_21564 [Prunus yedoensis var. nudiflora]|uniref:Uncharacterized protein n=1 Tax=Prunus yedoensis var. nudiflora TaxID=2094558 RepID=A0A314YL79_PRUYE|nr:hypothetical protein Pyn_21564 [Prunus yedoensis var. nudiflora]